MTLTKQRFSANSFSGMGTRREASFSGGSLVGAAGTGRASMSGALGASGFGKGFGMAGGGGGGGFRVMTMSGSSLGSGMGNRGRLGGGGGQFGFGGSGAAADASFGVVGNEKLQMQCLNDRLAAYLDQVRMLEAANYELEERLKSLTFNKVISHDFTKFNAQIKPLKQQLLAAVLQHTHISVAIDNAKLAAEDFRLKWEMEVSLRQATEGDIAGLRALRRDYDQANQAMGHNLQSLIDEYTAMEKNHQQELLSVRKSLTGDISVSMQAAENADLTLALAEIRAEYEAAMDHNRRQAEDVYMKQMQMKQVASTQLQETAASGTQEATEGRNHFLGLQMEMEALCMGNVNLKSRLEEVQDQYQERLLSMSHLVAGLEGDLSSLRHGITQQGQEYQNLLDIKSRLEMEINTYKQLLEQAGFVGADMGSVGGGALGAGQSVGMVNKVAPTRRGVIMSSAGTGGASLMMASRKPTTSFTSSSGAAVMSSSGTRGAAMTKSSSITSTSSGTSSGTRGAAMTKSSSITSTSSATSSGGGVATLSSVSAIPSPGGTSTVIKTSKTVTSTSSSGDADAAAAAVISSEDSTTTRDGSMVVRTSKTVTTTSGSEDAFDVMQELMTSDLGATTEEGTVTTTFSLSSSSDGAAVMPSDEGAEAVMVSSIDTSAGDSAVMKSDEDSLVITSIAAESSEGASAMEGGMTVESAQMSDSDEFEMSSEGAAECMMEDGGVASITADLSISSADPEGASMTSGEAAVSSGDGSMPVPSSSPELVEEAEDDVMSPEDESTI